ncbi:MAG: hypothetical protein SGPRY_012537 [Prymnesium sp.]
MSDSPLPSVGEEATLMEGPSPPLDPPPSSAQTAVALFCQLARPYFSKHNPRRRVVLLETAALLGLCATNTGLFVFISYAQRDFSTAMAAKDTPNFYVGAGKFAVVRRAGCSPLSVEHRPASPTQLWRLSFNSNSLHFMTAYSPSRPPSLAPCMPACLPACLCQLPPALPPSCCPTILLEEARASA